MTQFIIYLISGVAMLALFSGCYVTVTPYKEKEQIKDGKVAPAISLVGAMLGFVMPIASMSFHGINFGDYVLWSFVAGFVQLVCFKVLYWILPNQIEADNIGAAVCYAGAAVCVGIITAFSLIP